MLGHRYNKKVEINLLFLPEHLLPSKWILGAKKHALAGEYAILIRTEI